MLEKFVKQTHFTSQEDFIKNLKIEVPENFNFGYDVVDAWAAEQPDKSRIRTISVCSSLGGATNSNADIFFLLIMGSVVEEELEISVFLKRSLIQ